MFVVTGATSHTGRAVAHSLLDRGLPVRVIGRSPDRLEPLVERGAEPVVGEPWDRAILAAAFEGATGVYAMLQPGLIPQSTDYSAYQRRVIRAIAWALGQARVDRVVALSGWGANYDRVSVPLEGLRVLEERLRGIDGLNTLVLRPGWFMENAIAIIQDIAKTGAASGQLRGDLPLPMIATADIGMYAAEELVSPSARGYAVREMRGPEQLTLEQAAAIVGKLTGRHNARYSRECPDVARSRLLSHGFSPQIADAVVRMTEDVNERRIRMVQPLQEQVITRTRFERFAETVLGSIGMQPKEQER